MELYYVHPTALWKTSDGTHMGAYLAQEVNAHIAELEKSSASTLAAVRGELTQAQQAIHRMTVETKTADQRLTAAKDRIAKLELALRDIVDSHEASDDGMVPLRLIDAAKSLMESRP